MKNSHLKILITIPWFYPAFRAGGPIQSIVNLVNQINQDVTFYVFTGNKDLNDEPIGVRENQWVEFNPQTKVWYSAVKNRKKSLLKQCKIIQPDVLYINGMFSWSFTIVPLCFCKGPLKIISPRGMIHPEALGVKSFKKKLYFNIWKSFNFQKGVIFHATDKSEFDSIRSLFGEATPITVASNFPRIFSHLPIPEKQPNCLQIVSIGLISPMKNYLEVLLGLQNISMNIDYHIYGPVKDNDYWQRCLSVIHNLPENIHVVYHGALEPEAVKSILLKAHVFILPSKSENFGHAIIEALSIGRPVITSNGTPWNGLEQLQAGLNVEPNPKNLANAICKFAAMNDSELKTYSEGASKYANNVLDLDKIKSSYLELFHGYFNS
ncbi:MAG: glycosyltransferase family 4 protein [Ferruginibacter sp.]|nr:glycosyltransferase family 4 protein [Ferruginibacter sp.]